jgi:hypothetical protein
VNVTFWRYPSRRRVWIDSDSKQTRKVRQQNIIQPTIRGNFEKLMVKYENTTCENAIHKNSSSSSSTK